MQNLGYKTIFYEEIRHFQFASVNLLIIFDGHLSPLKPLNTEHQHPKQCTVHTNWNQMKQNTLFSLQKWWLFVGLCIYGKLNIVYFLEISFCGVHEMFSGPHYETIRIHNIIFWFKFVEVICIWKRRNRYCIKWMKTKPLKQFEINEN